MVDREARNRMAELLRHFVAARIDTDELVSGLYYRGRDHTAAYIADVLVDNYWFKKPQFINRKRPLSRRDRRQLARIAMYLRTGLERPKPRELPVIVQILRAILTLPAVPILPAICLVYLGCRAVIGLFTGNWAREDVAGEIWPFAGLDEYEEALKSPKLLCGKRAG